MKTRILKALILFSYLVVGAICYTFWKPIQFTSKSHFGTEVKCERGYLKVPENYDNPKSDYITIEFVVLKSFNNKPKTPIFYLAGGPGDNATNQANNPGALKHWVNYLPERDVVLINQRGVGKLNMWWVSLSKPNKDFLLSDENAIAHFMAISQKALLAFQKRGINLKAYNTKASAADIDAVRAHLDYDKIIPLGFSYGTHLGLAYLKAFESKVEKIILAGCEGLDKTFKLPSDLDQHFDMIANMVAKDSTINKHIPDLKALYIRVANKMGKTPIKLTIKNPIKLKRELLIGRFGLNYILKRDLGDRNDIPFFPRLLYDIDKGDYNILQQFVQKRYREFIAIPAMTLSMDLSSGVNHDRLSQIKEQEATSIFGKVANAPFIDLSTQWPIKDLGKEFRAPLRSNIPALFLSGQLDINTPAYQADSIAQYFPNSTHLVVQNAGHEQILACWDTPATIKKFIAGQHVENDTLKYPELKFIPLF